MNILNIQSVYNNIKTKFLFKVIVAILIIAIMVGTVIYTAISRYHKGYLDGGHEKIENYDCVIIPNAQNLSYNVGRKAVIWLGDGCTFFAEIKEAYNNNEKHTVTKFIYHASPFCNQISSCLCRDYRHTDLETQWRQTEFCDYCMTNALKKRCGTWLFVDKDYLEYIKNKYNEENDILSITRYSKSLSSERGIWISLEEKDKMYYEEE